MEVHSKVHAEKLEAAVAGYNQVIYRHGGFDS